jgi:hypothetical protein
MSFKRRVVGDRGDGFYLVALGPPSDHHSFGIVVHDDKVVGEPLPLQSIIARGYWQPFTGTDAEAEAILKHVPEKLDLRHPI